MKEFKLIAILLLTLGSFSAISQTKDVTLETLIKNRWIGESHIIIEMYTKDSLYSFARDKEDESLYKINRARVYYLSDKPEQQFDHSKVGEIKRGSIAVVLDERNGIIDNLEVYSEGDKLLGKYLISYSSSTGEFVPMFGGVGLDVRRHLNVRTPLPEDTNIKFQYYKESSVSSKLIKGKEFYINRLIYIETQLDVFYAQKESIKSKAKDESMDKEQKKIESSIRALEKMKAKAEEDYHKAPEKDSIVTKKINEIRINPDK